MKKIYLFLMLGCCSDSVSLYSQSMYENMIKYTVNTLKGLKVEKDMVDDVIEDADTSIIPSGTIDEKFFLDKIQDLSNHFSAKVENNASSIVDDKEYVNEEISLNFKSSYLPYCKATNINFDVTSVKDKQNTELILSPEQKEKYQELGIIENGNYYGDPYDNTGKYEYEETVWLNKEPEYHEKIKFEGTAYINYPTSYKRLIFNITDVGKSQTIENINYTLLSVNGNQIFFKVDSRVGESNQNISASNSEAQKINYILLNKENKPFDYITSSSFPYFIYEYAKSKDYNLSDEEVKTLAKQMEEGNKNNPTVLILNVHRLFDKIIFYKGSDFKEKKMPFSFEWEYKFE